MAFPSSALLMTLALLSVSVTLPSAQALVIADQLISSALIGGVLTCPLLSTGGVQTIIQNAPVDLVCGTSSLQTVLQSGVTNLAGVYLFALTTADTLAFDPAACFLRVTVPAATCTVNLPSGLLRAPLTLLQVVPSLVGNFVAVFVGSALSLISV